MTSWYEQKLDKKCILQVSKQQKEGCSYEENSLYNNRALGSTFAQNISVAGGAASVTTYDKQVLLKAVLDGDINPGRVFTNSYSLDEINQAYKDMDERKSIKSIIVFD